MIIYSALKFRDCNVKNIICLALDKIRICIIVLNLILSILHSRSIIFSEILFYKMLQIISYFIPRMSFELKGKREQKLSGFY